MRKSEREVIGEQEKFEALLRCPFLTLGMRGEVPYLVPLNFGAELCEGQLVLYFHCAKEGKKLDFLRLDPNVSFSAANMLRVFNKGVAPCGFTPEIHQDLILNTSGRIGRQFDIFRRVKGVDGALYGRNVCGRFVSPAAFGSCGGRKNLCKRMDLQAVGAGLSGFTFKKVVRAAFAGKETRLPAQER